jgi:hypothetical protein
MGQVFPPNGVLYPDDSLPDRRPLLGSATFDHLVEQVAATQRVSRERATEIVRGLFNRWPPTPPPVVWPETEQRAGQLLADAVVRSWLGHDPVTTSRPQYRSNQEILI